MASPPPAPVPASSQELFVRGNASKHRQDILDLLDSLENTVPSPATSASPAVSTSTVVMPAPDNTTTHTHHHAPDPSVLATVNPNVKDRLTRLRDSVKEKESMIAHLKAKKAALEQRFVEDVETIENEVEMKARTQHATHEECLRKAVAHTSALLEAKEKLVKELQELRQDLNAVTARCNDDMRQLEADHAHALTHMKGQWAIEEKQKRDAWKKQQTEKIRETTLKALEPDIAAMLSRHKAELTRLDREHAEAIQRRNAEIQEQEGQLRAQRAAYQRELDAAVQRERDLGHEQLTSHRTRCEQTLHEEQSTLRRREAEYEEQMQNEVDAQRRQLHLEREALSRVHEEVASLKAQRESQRRQRLELQSRQIEERLQSRRQQLDAHYRSLLESEKEKLRASAEMELQQVALKLRHDTDEEIRKVRAALEHEHNQHVQDRATSQARFEREMREIEMEKEGLQSELKVLASATEHRENALRVLRSEHMKLTQELNAHDDSSRQEMDVLKQRLEHEAAQAHREADDSLAALRQQWDALLRKEYQEYDEQKAAHAKRVAEIKAQNESSLADLTSRIQSAIASREAKVREAEQEVFDIKKRALSAEAVLAETRALLE